MIEVGRVYVRHALPPGRDPLYSTHWVVISTCGVTTSDCPRYWNIDSEDAAAQREGRLPVHAAIE